MALLIDEPAVRHRTVGVVRVGGHDRLSYLHTLLSQQLESARPGAVADFLHLDAKGNPKAAGRAVVRAGDVLLVTAPEVAQGLAAELEQFKFLLDVEAADASASWALASIRGPAGDIPSAGARDEPMTAAPHDPGIVVRDRSGGIDLLGPTDWVAQRAAGTGLPEATHDDWEAWRILAGEPAWGSEITAGRRPQELGLLPTHVHLRKGCYPGQEAVAKMWNLGKPRRGLAVLELAVPVEPGQPLTAADKAGEVTSAAPHGGRWVALAMLPLAPDGSVRGGGTVAVADTKGRVLHKVGEGLPQPGA